MNSQPEPSITGKKLLTSLEYMDDSHIFKMPEPSNKFAFELKEGTTVFIQVGIGKFNEYVVEDGKLILVKEANQ